ncbi:zinc finger protein SHOOT GRAVITROPISM 5 [Dioscorea cayenensis subsp. rotundata]|uniref:Zinc finger protein SHOOT GRAVITROPISM 5 n=1 Tax=Dioscorea cayennensis subsp. rotundata TaxID=55577 RepID=A0AB40C1D0_DIOCR|nr:zinc finger protein SHOOT GRAVITROPISM 5 [Dioscorea cayenensis subsp. rotundata]
MELEDEDKRELQLLLSMASSRSSPESSKTSERTRVLTESPVLDLNLSISTGSGQTLASDETVKSSIRNVQILKQQTAEQIRLATVEKAYAERVRELTRRELELAEKEFARARLVWERAREEVEKAERMKELATRRIGSTCMEITCQGCRQRFQP